MIGVAQFYVRYARPEDSLPPRYGGPFSTREDAIREAERGLAGVAWMGHDPMKARVCWLAMVLPSHKIRAGEFIRFCREWLLGHHGFFGGDFPVPFRPDEIASRRLRALYEKAMVTL